jgi:hypothetical protein
MRNIRLYLSAMTLAGFASLPLAAQQPAQNPAPSNPPQSAPADSGAQQATPPQQSSPEQPSTTGQHSNPPQNTAPAVPVQSTATAPEVGNAELRPVQGELEKKLDSKTAKVGDAVVVKTTEKATIADGLVIPKGSKIVGQVVDAQAAGKGSQNSKVTVLFDHAELKSGQNLPIKSVLQSVAPAESSDASAAAGIGGASAAPMSSSGGGAPMSSPGTGNAAGTGGSASARQTSPTPSQQGNASTMAGTNAEAGNSAPVAGTVVAQQGNVAIKTTGIPGVLIAANANGQPFSNASGALLGARQNVHLDGGTHVVLAITDAGTKGTNTR